MDSLSQIALGAAVGTAVLGHRHPLKAAAWGAVCGTLPDLDVLWSHGDPVRDFTLHRAETHALFYQTLAAPLLGWLITRVHRHTQADFWRWTLLVWLALATHALLDAFTVYGTQVLLPFSDYPVGLGSVFIIDPLYTLPLLTGLTVALLQRRRPQLARHANALGLAISTLYLAWSVAVQSHVEGMVHRSLAATGEDHGRMLVTPTAFNTLLWRVVIMERGGFREGFVSLLDDPGSIVLARYPSRSDLLAPLQDDWSVRRLAWFAKGFYVVGVAPADTQLALGSPGTLMQLLGAVATASAAGTAGDSLDHVVIADLRMGQVPWFVFAFAIAATDGVHTWPVPPRQLPVEPPNGEVLGWLWQRIWSEQAGPVPVD